MPGRARFHWRSCSALAGARAAVRRAGAALRACRHPSAEVSLGLQAGRFMYISTNAIDPEVGLRDRRRGDCRVARLRCIPLAAGAAAPARCGRRAAGVVGTHAGAGSCTGREDALSARSQGGGCTAIRRRVRSPGGTRRPAWTQHRPVPVSPRRLPASSGGDDRQPRPIACAGDVVAGQSGERPFHCRAA